TNVSGSWVDACGSTAALVRARRCRCACRWELPLPLPRPTKASSLRSSQSPSMGTVLHESQNARLTAAAVRLRDAREGQGSGRTAGRVLVAGCARRHRGRVVAGTAAEVRTEGGAHRLWSRG